MKNNFVFAALAIAVLLGLVVAVYPMPLAAQQASPTPEITASPAPTPTPTPIPEDEDGDKDEEEEDVDDVSDVDVEKLPFTMGRFQLLGTVTAVNAGERTIGVNGLTLKVAPDAKVRGEKVNIDSLEDVAVNDRVAVSGRIEQGMLIAEKIRAIRPAFRQFAPEAVEKLRQDIMKRIEEILKKIEELRARVR